MVKKKEVKEVKIILLNRKNVMSVTLVLVGLALVVIGYGGLGNNSPTADATAGADYSGQTIEIGAPEFVDEEAPVTDVPDLVTEPTRLAQSTEKTRQSEGFFVEYRIERERTRGQQVEWLREIINNPNSDSETRKKAQEQLYTISQNLGKEMEIENLIRAKGFDDAVVLIQEDPTNAVTVVVKTEKLTTDQTAQVAELVSRNTGINMSHVVIIPKF
ncbi:SpoIIIAH-like family protein [Desulfofalx alkaliphila]|uniref:SpoIIIAH-like family protein n=1 Tax=Desulfofalx alkaliphila TaxID=105483 RepID=UPI00068C08C0|nr:SpoIIIAH-like family protein [Desulfofalx alkaliphila]